MTTREKPGAVFDCMLYLQAVASDVGPAAACFRLLESGIFALFISHEVLAEVRDVLGRPRIRARNPRLTDERVEAFLEQVRKYAALVHEVPTPFSYERDPKDEKYVNLALAAAAPYLVSRDQDLLGLMNATPHSGNGFPA